MAKHERNRGVRIYHSIVSIALLLAGFAFIALGIWLRSNESQGVSELKLEGDVDTLFKIFLNLHWASIVVGCFLVMSAIFSLIALARNCVGFTFRFIYVVLAIVIFIVLLVGCVVSSLLLANRYNQEIYDVVKEGWKSTYSSQPEALCVIETRLECRGFDYGDCDGCVTGLEEACHSAGGKDVCARCPPPESSQEGEPLRGCYQRILDFLHNLFLPIAIVSGISAAAMLIDIFSTCAL